MDVKDGYMKEGACIGLGICNSGMPSETDATYALLAENVDSEEKFAKRGSIIGLGLAYAGSGREDIQELLTPTLL